ncbi:kinase-like domain-containing protein [Massariosphaeria phaeospora]|uniref:cyclin-dependent kinase n=1 Tax=Massariosphaeria phaeospora TaxID=100035 RepID=A0A7C8IJ30_9PLEO|nr:kinase-like domain-containing protein [Massariosphaeria phaeospora]
MLEVVETAQRLWLARRPVAIPPAMCFVVLDSLARSLTHIIATMASVDWHSKLDFSTRLSAITKITAAYQSSFPSVSTADARREAVKIETQFYDETQSAEDYVRKCEEQVAALCKNCVESTTSDDEVPVPSPTGMEIGSYKNAIYYKEGLFSAVYKATALDEETYFSPDTPSKKRLVALKVTTPSAMEPPHDSRREAAILRIAASENVIPILETFREAGTRFVIVLPFMAFDLDRLLQDERLSKGQTKRCLKDMFSALAFIHSHDIIHRDVKPSNLLVKSLDGPAYLSDFGISWAPMVPGSEPASSKITDVGTTCYRPPELLFGNKSYGCSLDLWAAGCTVAEALVPDHSTLFDSGELGSDLALIQSMFSKLGTPNSTVWPESAHLPDWGKMQFKQYPALPWSVLLPKCSEDEIDLVSSLVRYESGARLTAAQVLEHLYPVDWDGDSAVYNE